MSGELVVSHRESLIQGLLVKGLCRHEHMRLLEIGYGLGLAHQHLRQADLAEHWVIEGNSWLAADCINKGVSAGDRAPIVLYDRWEHALGVLPPQYFDAVLFDPYPLDDEARLLTSWSAKFAFVARMAASDLHRILRNTGEVGFINFEPNRVDSTASAPFEKLFNIQRVLRTPDESGSDGTIEQIWIMGRRT